MMNKNHYFFLLPSSPWPFLSSMLSFNLLFSFLIFLKSAELYSMLMSLFFLVFCMMFWWSNYMGEFNLEGKNSSILLAGVKFSMILFISSEVFFFFSFFWSYFHFYLSPSMNMGLIWPPYSYEFFDFLNVPLINTLVLLMSGVTVTIAHHYFNKSSYKTFNCWLLLTITLGLIFTYLQKEEYNSSFFTMTDGNFGTAFFMLTGFHGLHVIIGSIFLFVCLTRSIVLHISKDNSLSFEMASWYWHFVDVVWLFLYYFLYYLNS